MSNRYYDHTTNPVSHSSASAAGIRAELDAVEAGFDQVQTEIDAAVVNAIGAVGVKNILINGRMKVFQRQTSVANIGPTVGGYYTADMWRIDCNANTLKITNSVSADHPVLTTNGWSFGVQVTTAEAAISAAEHFTISQRIEANACYDIRGKTVTLQFWVKSPKTGIHCVAFRTNPALVVKTQVKEYTVDVADTWEQKTITLDMNTAVVTAGFVVGMDVIFTLFAGSTYQTTADAWNTGNFVATSNQQNLADTIGNVFAITDVQLELGSTATDIENRPIELETSMCERFYEKSYNINVYPGTAFTGGTSQCQGSGTSGGPIVISQQFATRKAGTPSMVFYDPAGTANKLGKFDAGWSSGLALGFAGTNAKGFMVGATPGGAAVILECQWTAEVTW